MDDDKSQMTAPTTARARKRRWDLQPLTVIALVVLIVVITQISGSETWLTIVTDVALAAIPTMALTVLLGWAGQAILCTAALLLVGAYTTVVVPAAIPGALVVTALFAGVVGAAVGLVAALPSRRLAGVYLLLSTLALQFIIGDVADYVQSASGHTYGYSPEAPNLAGFRIDTASAWLWVSAIAMCGVYLYFRYIRRTRIGRALITIRDDIGAARVTGISPSRHLIGIFMITAAITSASGALAGYYNELVTYQGFDVFASISYFVMVVVGGAGSLPGAILGAGFVTALPQVLPLFSGAQQSTTISYVEQIIYAGVALAVIVTSKALIRRVRSRLRAVGRGASRNLVRLEASREIRDGAAAVATLQGQTRVVPGELDKDVVLRLTDVAIAYDSALGVSGVTVDVSRGKSVSLVGPNGAGKTSTLLAAVGAPLGSSAELVRGSVLFQRGHGPELLNGRSAEYRAQVGIVYVPAEGKVFNELTVRDHLELAHPQEISAAQARTRQNELFTVFSDLPDLQDRRAGHLSGGERQQLALMCALMREPLLLVADELSLGLSPAAIERLVGALLRVREMGTVSMLLAEQNTAVALASSDWVVAMASGGVRAQGTSTREFEARLREEYLGAPVSAVEVLG